MVFEKGHVRKSGMIGIAPIGIAGVDAKQVNQAIILIQKIAL